MRKLTPQFTFRLIAVALLVAGCSGRKVDTTTEAAPEEKDQKIEQLTSALSRAQSRIEELDAKLSAMGDKLDSTRLTLDNIAGTKPLKTVVVGSAAHDTESAQTVEKSSSKKKPVDTEMLRHDSAITNFTKAMSLFKTGKYTDSELAFNHFAETYPEHVLAGSAQFYNGESYFMMGEYKLALNEYGKVVSSFSSSPRVASAMVRMSHCYDAVGNSAEANRTLALARDLYEGNPSLDWPAPAKGKKPDAPIAQNDKLNVAPIEPIAPAKTHNTVEAHSKVMTIGGTAPDDRAKQQDDDKKIDELDEKKEE